MIGFNKPPIGSMLDFTHPMTVGLVGYYAMNELRGTRVNDLSLRPAPGTATNFAMSPSTTSNWGGSPFGGGLLFDGTDDHINIGASIPKFNLNELTITAWIKPSTISSGTRQIVSDSDNGGNNARYTFEINRTAGKLSALVNGATFILATGATSLSTSKWQFVACTRSGIDPSWTLKLYLNGIEDGSATGTQALQTQNTLAIGRLGAGAFHLFSGGIDEVRIYNRVLTVAEIKALSTSPHLDFLTTSPKKFYIPARTRVYATII
jgi:hypothetical protein